MSLVHRIAATQQVLDDWLGRPFVWGENDCAHLCAAMLFAMGHDDPLSDIKPYATQRGAKRALKKAGYTDLDGALDALGLERIAPARAMPGDLVGLPGEGWTALGVAVGQGRVIAFASGSCAWGPIDACAMAWSVPCLK